MTNNEFKEICTEIVEVVNNHISTQQTLSLNFASNVNFQFMKDHIKQYLDDLSIKHEMHCKNEVADYSIKIIFKSIYIEKLKKK